MYTRIGLHVDVVLYVRLLGGLGLKDQFSYLFHQCPLVKSARNEYIDCTI